MSDIINSRMININTDMISIEMAGEICSQIYTINEFDVLCEHIDEEYVRRPITVFINTYGGDAYASLGIVNAIKSSITPVITITPTIAFSGGFLIAIAGHKRYAQPYSTFMCHSLAHGIEGKLQELRSGMIENDRMQNILDSLVKEYTKINDETLIDMHVRQRDLYFDSQQALDLGLIDGIITNYNMEEIFDFVEKDLWIEKKVSLLTSVEQEEEEETK